MDRLYPNLNRRVKAVLIDAIVFVTLIVAVIPVIAKIENLPDGLRILLMLTPFFILEPVLVTLTGGSIGHHLMQLRIRRRDRDARVDILAATIRFMVKTFLGVLSLFFIAFTRKHQALHDKLANSLVVFKHTENIAPHEILPENIFEEPGYSYPSKFTRIMMSALYGLAAVFGLNLFGSFWISDACIDRNICTVSEQAILLGIGMVSLLLVLFIFQKGLRAELPGCRKKKTP